MPNEEGLLTLEEAHDVVLASATAEGRCPYCGRRHDDDNDKLFKTLREEVATANTERDEAKKDLQEAQDSNVLYAAEVDRLTALVKEAG